MAANYPINAGAKIKQSIAITDIEIMRIKMDLLDIMMTWDQLSGNCNLTDYIGKSQVAKHHAQIKIKTIRTSGDWMNDTEVISAYNLQLGIFSCLPEANVEEMFKRTSAINVIVRQVIIE